MTSIMCTVKSGSMTSVDGCKDMPGEPEFVVLNTIMMLVSYIVLHSDAILKQLASSVSSLRVPKSLLGWDLEKLETLAGGASNHKPDGA